MNESLHEGKAIPRCLHHLFEDQVQRMPINITVSLEGLALTYDEMNLQADCLGARLQQTPTVTVRRVP